MLWTCSLDKKTSFFEKGGFFIYIINQSYCKITPAAPAAIAISENESIPSI